MKRIQAVCWDLDNTILPSKRIAIEIMDELLPKYGIHEKPDYSKHHASFGLPLEQFIKLHSKNHTEHEAMLHDFINFQQKYYGADIEFFDGMLDVIAHFHKQGYKQALITSRRHKGRPVGNPTNILKNLGVVKYFSFIISGDDVKNHKPHPEPMEKTLQALKLPPESTVMIGDQPIDIEMAKSAGCKAIGIDHEGNPDYIAALWHAGADHVVTTATSLQIAVEELEQAG